MNKIYLLLITILIIKVPYIQQQHYTSTSLTRTYATIEGCGFLSSDNNNASDDGYCKVFSMGLVLTNYSRGYMSLTVAGKGCLTVCGVINPAACNDCAAGKNILMTCIPADLAGLL